MPTRLTPRFVPKLWGSTHLEPWFPNPSEKIGEVWFEGVPDLPLLIKFLFTTDKLSVQVHPDDAYARLHHNSPGKTEMWHILAAEPGARIAAGFREPITRERLIESSLSGEIEDLLEWHEARPGDTFFIPAGTVHAIGAGLVLCEIQQHSDITYRLYDYGRRRDLHLEHAANVSNLGPCAVRQPAREGQLVSCPYFTTAKHIARPHGEWHCEPLPSTAAMVVVMEGTAVIDGQAASPGDVWYAAPGSAPFDIASQSTILVTGCELVTKRTSSR